MEIGERFTRLEPGELDHFGPFSVYVAMSMPK
jgi:hypothetical protein